jgi:hypothetical protein
MLKKKPLSGPCIHLLLLSYLSSSSPPFTIRVFLAFRGLCSSWSSTLIITFVYATQITITVLALVLATNLLEVVL